MNIRKHHVENLRENRSQGLLECFSVIFLFDLALYLHSGNLACLLISTFSFPMILVGLCEAPNKETILGIILRTLYKIYWVLFVPSGVFLGIYCFPPLLYASLNVILYFQMLKGISKVFTAGEHFINSHILISLLYFGCNSFSMESTIMFYSMKMFVMFWIVYTIVGAILAKGKTSENLPQNTFKITWAIILGVILFQVYANYGNHSAYWAVFYNMLLGTRQKAFIFIYSALVTFVGMAIYPWFKRYFQLSMIPSRKYFHLLGYILFTPGFIYEPLFMLLALNMALVGTFLLDYLRLQPSQKSSVLSSVGNYYHSFSPASLHGKFIFAPVSLLGGCVLTLEFLYFITEGNVSQKDVFFSTCGVTFLTIGDSLNGIIGSTLSCFGFGTLASLIFMYNIVPHFSLPLLVNSILSALLMSILEGYTTQNDNYVVTLFYLAVQLILNYFWN